MQANPADDGHLEGLLAISNIDRLGSFEVEQANKVADAVRHLLDLEHRLARGELVDLVAEAAKFGASPDIWKEYPPGLGDHEVTGFPVDECPPECPDLAGHHSVMAEILRHDGSIYPRLRQLKTSLGVTLAKVIKPGVDYRGHPLVRFVGAVAGDAECYATFADLLLPIAHSLKPAGRGHGSSPTELSHHIDLTPAKVAVEEIDPTGLYFVSCRIRASRNLRGKRFPSAISRTERLAVEQLLVQACNRLAAGGQGGNYQTLAAATLSCNARAGEDSQEDDPDVDHLGLLFYEPDAVTVLSSGMARHWPEARGVFVNADRSLVVWVNEEDHLRFSVSSVSLQHAFAQFVAAEGAVRAALQEQGEDYAQSQLLGYLTSCPSKMGTGGMQVSCTLRLPPLSDVTDFKALCRSLDVTVRHTTSPVYGAVWNLELHGCYGQSEVELVNQAQAAFRHIVAVAARTSAADAAVR